MFSMLLLALGDRADAAPAARLASSMAARLGAGLAVLHVSGPLSQDAACVLALPDEQTQTASRAKVEELLRRVMPAGQTADVLHGAGFTHLEALKAARVLGPDLLLLGGLDRDERCRRELSATSEGGEASSALLTAESSACPVLFVPEGAQLPTGPFLRVLVAVDPSVEPSASRPLLALAARLAAREGAELTACGVIDLPGGAPLPTQSEMTKRIEGVRERLAFLCHGLPGSDRFTLAASEGAPAVEILKQARERGADLLVLGLPAKGRWAVAGRVLAGARGPVLLAGPLALARQDMRSAQPMAHNQNIQPAQNAHEG